MMLLKTRWLALMLVGSVTLAACGGAGQAETAMRVEAKEFTFSPANLEVTAGQPVKLTLRNTGTLEHDFSVAELPMEGEAEVSGGMDHDMDDATAEPELHVATAAKGSATLEFTPTKPGTYEFWCTVPGHKAAGMTGTLVVKAP
jgi:uncharacterized cupredoxin-like copper-binding protein